MKLCGHLTCDRAALWLRLPFHADGRVQTVATEAVRKTTPPSAATVLNNNKQVEILNLQCVSIQYTLYTTDPTACCHKFALYLADIWSWFLHLLSIANMRRVGTRWRKSSLRCQWHSLCCGYFVGCVYTVYTLYCTDPNACRRVETRWRKNSLHCQFNANGIHCLCCGHFVGTKAVYRREWKGYSHPRCAAASLRPAPLHWGWTAELWWSRWLQAPRPTPPRSPSSAKETDTDTVHFVCVDKMFILSNMTLLIHYSLYAVREILF